MSNFKVPVVRDRPWLNAVDAWGYAADTRGLEIR